jgi:protein-disulfide isomerase
MEEAMAEKVMGKDDAPVTMVEYSSLGCPHCASFHRETLPQIKKSYIDTGKVRLVFRDFPFGGVALAAHMLARCAAPKRYFGFIEVLFRSQPQWAQSNNPRAALLQVARLGGMSEQDFETCLKNETLMNSIRGGADTANKEFAVKSTPTFFINGTKVSGARPFADFKDAIEKALKNKS